MSENGIPKKEIAEILLKAENSCKDIRIPKDRRRCKVAVLQAYVDGADSKDKKRMRDKSVKEILKDWW